MLYELFGLIREIIKSALSPLGISLLICLAVFAPKSSVREVMGLTRLEREDTVKCILAIHHELNDLNDRMSYLETLLGKSLPPTKDDGYGDSP